MNTDDNLKELGKRLRKAREDAKLTQFKLYEITGISTTQISAYENGNKSIGLGSLYKIALATGKTIDELYVGSENMKPISSAKNEGEMVVNCIDALFDAGVVQYNYRTRHAGNDFVVEGGEFFYKIGFAKYVDILDDMVSKLADFKKNKDTYPDPENFRKQILASAAKQINDFAKLLETKNN